MAGSIWLMATLVWITAGLRYYDPNDWTSTYRALYRHFMQVWQFLHEYMADALAIVAIAIALWPRINVDFSETYTENSPFPASVTVTNFILPLHDVGLFLRFCSGDLPGGGKIIGHSDCTKSNTGKGGVRMSTWTGRLGTDDKWTVPLGQDVPFSMPAAVDVLFVITYWPWPFPDMSPTISPPEYVARFSPFRRRDGSIIWTRKPLDP